MLIEPFYNDGAPKLATWPHGLAEWNVLVLRGKPVHIRMMEIPKRHGTGCFDVLLNNNNAELHNNKSNKPFTCLASATCPHAMSTCHNYTLGLAKLMPTISAYSSALGEFFGADWYRLDFFYGHPSRGVRVNEVLPLLSLLLLPTRACPPPDLDVISAIYLGRCRTRRIMTIPSRYAGRGPPATSAIGWSRSAQLARRRIYSRTSTLTMMSSRRSATCADQRRPRRRRARRRRPIRRRRRHRHGHPGRLARTAARANAAPT